jgi:hypothetical protein
VEIIFARFVSELVKRDCERKAKERLGSEALEGTDAEPKGQPRKRLQSEG